MKKRNQDPERIAIVNLKLMIIALGISIFASAIPLTLSLISLKVRATFTWISVIALLCFGILVSWVAHQIKVPDKD